MPRATEPIDRELVASSARDMVRYGRAFYSRGWNLATSSNYSAVISHEPFQLLMTASGFHKGELTESDFVLIDRNLQRIDLLSGAEKPVLKPSAEAALHVALAKRPGVGSVLHTHSVWATIIAEQYFNQGYVELKDYEMLKALTGIKSHQESVKIAILENSQDMNALAEQVDGMLDVKELQHAFILRGHGLYTWADSLSNARNQIEALEFLFEVVGRSGGS